MKLLQRMSAVFLGLAVTAAMAQQFPEKTLQYIVPFPAGGESDVVARLQQDALRRLHAKDMVILNKAGAGGGLAWGQLNNLPADGYNVVSINLPHIVLQPLEGQVQYKTEDIKPVYFYTYTPDALIVSADSPFKTLQDLIRAAKERPGVLTIGGTGTNSANHLAAARLNQITGISTTYVPFKGSGDLNPMLLGNHIQAMMSYTTAAFQLRDKVRVLAVAMPSRHPQLPGVPTFKELGIDWVDGAYRGVAVPKTVPLETQRKLSALFAEINRDPEYMRKMASAGFELVDVPLTGVDAFMGERSKGYLVVAKSMGLIK
jgi:tripartite-type tricarboxylate transporter receptor subunit TctC